MTKRNKATARAHVTTDDTRKPRIRLSTLLPVNAFSKNLPPIFVIHLLRKPNPVSDCLLQQLCKFMQMVRAFKVVL